jgi:uncharacterized protein YdiU (UPF0061 family)
MLILAMYFVKENSFSAYLPSDPIEENYVRQVKNTSFSFVNPTIPLQPKYLHANGLLAREMGFIEDELYNKDWLEVLSGSKVYQNTRPSAMCYGGHQFGQWAGQLGDGRAINLFEIINNDKIYALQLKGAGKTPYSRSADGLAVLRSSIREYLCSEAMHYLGIPTTRALSLISSGDQVWRDMLYDGNAAYEPGAIVCRVAPSFIRFGNFQIHAARKEFDILKRLVDYVIDYFFPEIANKDKVGYLAWLNVVAEKTIDLIVEWERVGFVHGVMNTDNMSILGLTIDYGPYGWLDDYDPNWTPNTTDASGRRYRFGNQANIAYWNIYQLANAIFPLINDAESVEKILDQIPVMYLSKQELMISKKLGFKDLHESNAQIIKSLPDLLFRSSMDMTLFYRNLIDFDGQVEDFITVLEACSYHPQFREFHNEWRQWLVDYSQASSGIYDDERTALMTSHNPKYVLRNYMAQMAIDAATKEDLSILNELFSLIQRPYDDQPEMQHWYTKRPDWAKQKLGCSMLSCSS